MVKRGPNPLVGDALHDIIRDTTRAYSTGSLHAENRALLLGLSDQSKPTEEQKNILRQLLQNVGTDVALNDSDLYGDGDQNPVQGEPRAQVFREIWEIGADVLTHLYHPQYMSDFVMHCIQGKTELVESILKKSSLEERRKLMEKRETGFRMSAILFVMAVSKHPHVVQLATGRRAADLDFVGVAKALLKYGARPNAKDLSGKTAAHYGVGSMATAVTLEIADYCIQASKSCNYFGETVVLHGLSNEAYNGKSCILGGYSADADRRIVFLENEGEMKEIAVAPGNIMYNNNRPIIDDSYKLVDIADRLGSVALHEVIMSNRTDVAKILLDKYDASLDISCGGVTPRAMSFQRLGGLHGRVIEMVRNHAIRTRPNAPRECNNCKVKETNGGPKLSHCKNCRDASYCSRDCQVADWLRHKAECKTKAVKLAKPPADGRVTALFNQRGTHQGGGYKKPRNVAIKEKFWVKVQAASDISPLLIYDETRDFTIYLNPNTSGFSELLAKVRAEPTSMGKKCHVQAMFEDNGDCFAYPFTATLKEWRLPNEIFKLPLSELNAVYS